MALTQWPDPIDSHAQVHDLEHLMLDFLKQIVSVPDQADMRIGFDSDGAYGIRSAFQPKARWSLFVGMTPHGKGALQSKMVVD